MEPDSPEKIASPRPTPQFFHDKQTFSTKKARLAESRGTPRESLPPRPPVKSAPPVSRIFPHRPVVGAHAVSFRKENSLLSPVYDPNKKELYFEQCFEIIAKIGAGSFGEVFKVRSKEDQKLYAIKRSQERFRGESDRRRKLEEVAKFEILPPHPNLVAFYRAWEEMQRLYIQIELCSLSLTQFAEQNHDIREMTIWGYLIDLLMAVKHLHDRNLIHMDIKPDNIFITEHDVCKLGDFGLVLDMNKNMDLSEAQEGDPKYLAPELLDGKFGKHADVFSLGMTMLELAGDLDLPKGGEGWHMLRKGQLPEEFLKTRSTSLKFIISQMLDPNHLSRPTVDQLLSFSVMRKYVRYRLGQYLKKTVKSNMLLKVLGWRLNGADVPEDVKADEARAMDVDQQMGDKLDDISDDVGVPKEAVGMAGDQSHDMDSFLMPPPTPRRAFTAPALRHRPFHTSSPLKSMSPVSSSRKRFTDDSPGSPLRPLDKSDDSERSLTPPLPRTLFPTEEDEEKPGIEPKNLMQMFDAASDED